MNVAYRHLRVQNLARIVETVNYKFLLRIYSASLRTSGRVVFSVP